METRGKKPLLEHYDVGKSPKEGQPEEGTSPKKNGTSLH